MARKTDPKPLIPPSLHSKGCAWRRPKRFSAATCFRRPRGCVLGRWKHGGTGSVPLNAPIPDYREGISSKSKLPRTLHSPLFPEPSLGAFRCHRTVGAIWKREPMLAVATVWVVCPIFIPGSFPGAHARLIRLGNCIASCETDVPLIPLAQSDLMTADTLAPTTPAPPRGDKPVGYDSC